MTLSKTTKIIMENADSLLLTSAGLWICAASLLLSLLPSWYRRATGRKTLCQPGLSPALTSVSRGKPRRTVFPYHTDCFRCVAFRGKENYRSPACLAGTSLCNLKGTSQGWGTGVGRGRAALLEWTGGMLCCWQLAPWWSSTQRQHADWQGPGIWTHTPQLSAKEKTPPNSLFI